MLHHVVEHANRLKRSWKEVYGLLIGYNKGTHVIVQDAIPITHGSSIHVQFNMDDYVFAANVNTLIAEKTNNLFFVGWYHSHPGLGLFLSGTDIHNHMGFQGLNPLACAIVFDHTIIEREEKGYQIFRLMTQTFGYTSVKNKVIDQEQNSKTKLNPIEELYYRYVHYFRKKSIINTEKQVRQNLSRWLLL